MPKGGITDRLRRIAVLATGLILLCSGMPAARAAGSLDFAKDTVALALPGVAERQHAVSFTLPLSAQPIIPSDWIIIDLPNYQNVTAANAVEGGFGSPVFYLEGTRAKVSNISVLPGTSVQISGITAANPLAGSNQLIIKVASDSAATSVRNQATVTPVEGGNFTYVSATFQSPLSGLYVAGFTSPGSFITLSENGTTVGTAAADALGAFSLSITGMQVGTHNLRLSGSDTLNRATSQAALTLDLVAGSVTTATNVLLSPTLSLDKASIQPGDTLTVFGVAKPNSSVNIFVESPLRGYAATSDASGSWSYTLDATETQKYAAGQYRVYANVQDDVGNQSIASATLTFTVTTAQTTDNPAPACDISKGDLNCDGKTNLTDFSILLFHWKTNHRVADINGDGSVNLTDFSIMMFYFKR